MIYYEIIRSKCLDLKYDYENLFNLYTEISECPIMTNFSSRLHV